MPPPIHIPRTQRGRTITHTTPDYRVFAVKRVPQWPTAAGGGEEARVQAALTGQLEAVLSRVASSGAGAPQRIDLFWVSTVSELLTLGPQPHELVIWFFPTFTGGLIQQYCTSMLGRRSTLSQDDVTFYETLISNNAALDTGTNARPCGQTLIQHVSRSGHPTLNYHCVEVYCSRVAMTVPHAGGRPRELTSPTVADVDHNLGVSIANVAFHEAMHAKVEPMKQRADHHLWDTNAWDMHTRLGGVARSAHYHGDGAVDAQNISDLKHGLLDRNPLMTVWLPDSSTSVLPLPPLPARAQTPQQPAIRGLGNLDDPDPAMFRD